MTVANAFPAFLTVEYDGGGGGFPAFERAADQMFNRVENRSRLFARNLEETTKTVSRAVVGTSGGLDLNLGQFRQAAADARLYEEKVRTLHQATAELAKQTGDTSQATKSYIQALSANSIEAESNRKAAEAQLLTYERLQSQLDTMVSSNDRLAASYREVYSEQAKSAQIEVNNRKFTNFATPAMSNRAIDNGAGYSALAAELDRVEQQERQAAKAAQEYAVALAEIRQQVDPAYFAQKRFNQEIANADLALKKGDISIQQHAERMSFLTAEMQRNITSTRQTRFASVQMGQQLQDMVIQAQMGTSAFVILAQQGSQVAYVLADVGGKVGSVARFMAGWQGAIVFASLAIVGQLIPALKGIKGAAEADVEALSKVKFTTSDLGTAQSILGSVLDIATGKMRAQREELVALGIAQAKVAALQARAQAEVARNNIKDLQDPSTVISGGMGGGLSIRRREAGAIGVASQDLLDGKITPVEMIDKLDHLRAAGRMTSEEFAQAAVNVADLGTALKNIKINEATERLLRGVGTKADKDLLLKPHKQREDHSAERLAERGDDAAKKIANITDRFSEIPPQVAVVNAAMRELDDLADDFSRKKPPNYDEIVKALGQARDIVRDGINKPVDDLLTKQSQQMLIMNEIIHGRQDEAAALQITLQLEEQRGKLSDSQKKAIMSNVVATRLLNREMDAVKAKQQVFLSGVSDMQASIRDSLSGLSTNGIGGSLGNLFSGLQKSLDNMLANFLTEKLFGNLFREIEDQITGAGRIKDAQDIMADALAQAAQKVESFGNVIAGVANKASGGNTNVPANDNAASTAAQEIIVTARRGNSQNPFKFFESTMTHMFGQFLGKESPIAKILGSAASGAMTGQIGANMLLGSNNSKAGSAIGGALGQVAGEQIGKKVGGMLGNALGPLGAIAGGLIGGLVGGIFKKSPSAGAVITSTRGDNAVTGNDAGAVASATGLGTNVQSALNRIIEGLGGTSGSFKVGIGQYKDYYRVSASGDYYPGAKYFSQEHPTDSLYNGPDANEALRIAVLNAIEDGAVAGIRAGTKKLLASGKDLDNNLQRALKFEGAFKELKKLTDPIGAALDEINLKFRQLRDIAKEAGATTEETAQIEQLYNMQRKTAVEEAMKSLTGSLTDLLKSITIEDSGYSIRTRLQNARAAYDPLAARVAAGDATAYSDFSSAAQTLIELQRQYSGSMPEYFALLDQVQTLTRGELGRQQSLYDTATGAATPFDTAPIVNATETQTEVLADALQKQFAALVAVNDNAAQQTELLRQIVKAVGAQTGDITGRGGF